LVSRKPEDMSEIKLCATSYIEAGEFKIKKRKDEKRYEGVNVSHWSFQESRSRKN